VELDAVARGEAGAVVSVRAEVGQHLASWRADADYRHGVSARRDLGGGTLLELSHDIDYVLAMLGAPSRVGALTTTSPALETDVEDVAHLLLAFDRGDQPPCVASISLDHVRHDTKRGCEVIGTEATLRWDALGARVERFDPSTRAWTELPIPATTAPDSYHAQFEHFMAVVRGETAPLSSPPDALRVLGVVDAARTSAREGRFVMMTTEAA
jgi:predicted dehydrogenase